MTFSLSFPGKDNVNHPSHYTAGNVEVIDVIEDWVKTAPDPVVGGLYWQCIKYLSRMWLKKDPYEDACKCRWYLNRLINTLAEEPYKND
jgi:hypothetical protein